MKCAVLSFYDARRESDAPKECKGKTLVIVSEPWPAMHDVRNSNLLPHMHQQIYLYVDDVVSYKTLEEDTDKPDSPKLHILVVLHPQQLHQIITRHLAFSLFILCHWMQILDQDLFQWHSSNLQKGLC